VGQACYQYQHQKKALKILYGLDFSPPTAQILKNHKLVSVSDLHKSMIAQFVHRQRLRLLPEPFDQYFQLNSETSRRSTRQSNLLAVTHVHTEQAKKMIRHAGPVIWNDLSMKTKINIQQLTIDRFKELTKSHYMSQY